MTTSVTVTTGARLHFGPLAASGAAGGPFGGVGMMVSCPRFVVRVERSVADEYRGEPAARERCARFVERIRTEVPAPPVKIDVIEAIPSHAGLGSGTQLGLAVAKALAELGGEQVVQAAMLARRAGRGLRSAIGLHGFERGGFLVDGGRTESRQLGTLVSRIEFPGEWRLVLVCPRQHQGLSGVEEQQAFASQPPMSESLTGDLCRIALMQWLPGLIEHDFRQASNAMYDFGMHVGRFFAAAQGGVFAHPQMRTLADDLRRGGIAGIAQTSWGPTICILCETPTQAQGLVDDLSKQSRWNDCEFQIAEPLNRGAEIMKSEGGSALAHDHGI